MASGVGSRRGSPTFKALQKSLERTEDNPYGLTKDGKLIKPSIEEAMGKVKRSCERGSIEAAKSNISLYSGILKKSDVGPFLTEAKEYIKSEGCSEKVLLTGVGVTAVATDVVMERMERTANKVSLGMTGAAEDVAQEGMNMMKKMMPW